MMFIIIIITSISSILNYHLNYYHNHNKQYHCVFRLFIVMPLVVEGRGWCCGQMPLIIIIISLSLSLSIYIYIHRLSYIYIYIYMYTRGLQEYCQRVLFRHPLIRRIAKQLKPTHTTFEEQGTRFEEWIDRILEIPEHPSVQHSISQYGMLQYAMLWYVIVQYIMVCECRYRRRCRAAAAQTSRR